MKDCTYCQNQRTFEGLNERVPCPECMPKGRPLADPASAMRAAIAAIEFKPCPICKSVCLPCQCECKHRWLRNHCVYCAKQRAPELALEAI